MHYPFSIQKESRNWVLLSSNKLAPEGYLTANKSYNLVPIYFKYYERFRLHTKYISLFQVLCCIFTLLTCLFHIMQIQFVLDTVNEVKSKPSGYFTIASFICNYLYITSNILICWTKSGKILRIMNRVHSQHSNTLRSDRIEWKVQNLHLSIVRYLLLWRLLFTRNMCIL